MRFTNEEFAVMVDQLLYQETVCFDMLCQIAEKTLTPAVKRWCADEPCLKGRNYENDIMQDIHIRLMKTVITGFLLRENVDGPYNNDPEGFEDWLFTVAVNLKRDFANAVRGRDFKTDDLDDYQYLTAPDNGVEAELERIEKLKQALNIVLGANVGVYKVLTWLAQFVFVLDMGITKIQSNECILAAFEDKTLYQMYDMLLLASRQIPWMEITDRQHTQIVTALGKKWDAEHTYGETQYKAFFMKHNGEISGKKSISDWVNRLNTMIQRKTGGESADAKQEEKGGQK